MPVGISLRKPVNPILQRDGVRAEFGFFAFASGKRDAVGAADQEFFFVSSSQGYSGKVDTSDGFFEFEAIHNPDIVRRSWTVFEFIAYAGHLASSAGINIYDEGLLVQENVSCIDFIGTEVLAQSDGSCVSVFIPPPNYVSHFDTTDGTTNGILVDLSTTQRNISSPTLEGTPFYSNGWTGLNPATRTGTLTWITPENISFVDQATTFDVVVSGPNGSIQGYVTPAITGNGTHIGGSISVIVSNWASDSEKYQGTVQISVQISVLLPLSGRFNVTITHTNGSDGTFIYTQSDAFYDSESQTFVLSGVTSALNMAVIKTISGVSYLTTGTTFDFGISDIDYANADTYPTNLIDLSLSMFGIPDESLQSGDLTGWTNQYDNQNALYSSTKSISVSNYRLCGGDADFTATPNDWVALASVPALALAVLIDTYADNATNGAISIIEEFNGETQRVNSDGSAWDSSITLQASELLVHCGSLMVQQGNFTAYLPHNGTTIVNPDYTSSGGVTQYYYRFYATDGSVRSGGVFIFSGVAEEDLLNGDINLEISLNGTDWYDATNYYLGGALIDGAGCRVSGQTMPNLEITLGTFSTANASGIVPVNSIMVRVSMPSTSVVEVDTMNFTWNT